MESPSNVASEVVPVATSSEPSTKNVVIEPAKSWLSWEQLQVYGKNHAEGVLGAFALLIAAWIVAGWVSRLMYRSLKLAKIDETLARFATKFTWWGVLVLAAFACLEIVGIKATSVAAAIGAVGFAIGLAFQGALGNFAAGIMLLVFRPYKVGDVIVVGGQTGKVDEIDLFSTTLDTPDNRRIMIPNGSIFGNTIENTSFHQTRRVEVTVGVGYAADIDHTYEVLMRAACTVPGSLSEPVPEVVLIEMAESCVNWSVRVWVNSADFGLIKQRTIRAIKMALDQASIEIPFPQMDINLRSSSAFQAVTTNGATSTGLKAA